MTWVGSVVRIRPGSAGRERGSRRVRPWAGRRLLRGGEAGTENGGMCGTEVLPHHPLRGSLPRWGKHRHEGGLGADSPKAGCKAEWAAQGRRIAASAAPARNDLGGAAWCGFARGWRRERGSRRVRPWAGRRPLRGGVAGTENGGVCGTEALPHHPLRGSLPRWGKHWGGAASCEREWQVQGAWRGSATGLGLSSACGTGGRAG